MSILQGLLRFFGLSPNDRRTDIAPDQAASDDQALIVRFLYGHHSVDPFFELDEVLHEAFLGYEPALYDGHEIAADLSEGTLFFYGPDADELLKLATPILLGYEFAKGAECTRRYGDATDENAPKVTTILGQRPS